MAERANFSSAYSEILCALDSGCQEQGNSRGISGHVSDFTNPSGTAQIYRLETASS